VDYSTGSVGTGATAPIWGAIARRYVVGPFGQAWHGHQFSLLGDAELDEGSISETVQDPMVAGLGEIVCVIDPTRQSLDRSFPASPRTGCSACSAPQAGRCHLETTS
jgi:pyruvate dehydrogenase E1 component